MAIVTWSGGFDMLYALQDAAFDRANGLHSIPSSIGVPNAIRVARALHVTAVVCLSLAVLSDPFSVIGLSVASRVQLVLWAGVAVVAAMLIWEHRLVNADDLSRLDAAFFTMNGIISIVFLCTALTARLLASGSVPLLTSITR